MLICTHVLSLCRGRSLGSDEGFLETHSLFQQKLRQALVPDYDLEDYPDFEASSGLEDFPDFDTSNEVLDAAKSTLEMMKNVQEGSADSDSDFSAGLGFNNLLLLGAASVLTVLILALMVCVCNWIDCARCRKNAKDLCADTKEPDDWCHLDNSMTTGPVQFVGGRRLLDGSSLSLSGPGLGQSKRMETGV